MKPPALNLAAFPIQARASIPWESVALRDLSECLLEAYDAVACRADELLQQRGENPGDELEDWRRAEDEVLQKIPIHVQESDLAITALISMPGYSAAEIELGIDARWIVILGRHPASDPAAAGEDNCSQPATLNQQSLREIGPQVFAVMQLPAVVDPSRCCAVLHDGLLGIRMLKAEPNSLPADLPRPRFPM
jgi:HSP20 family molecular chaperone IbpA